MSAQRISRVETRSWHEEINMTIIGTLIEMGDDDQGQPRLLIHTDASELRGQRENVLYKTCKITFEVIEGQLVARKRAE